MAIKAPKMSAKTTVAVCVAASFVILLVLFAAGRSFYTRITHNARVISKKQAAESQLKTNLNNLPALSSAYDNLGPTQDLIKKALPDTSDFPAIVATMEVIAGASNVNMASVSPLGSLASSTPTAGPVAAASSDSSPLPFQYSVNVKGPYSGVLSFLSNLQISARPIIITGIQLSGTTDLLTGTINCQTYSFNPPILADKTVVVK